MSKDSISGFMLLKSVSNNCYRGIERETFEPLLIDGEFNFHKRYDNDIGESNHKALYSDTFPRVRRIWPHICIDWKREAYRLYEEHTVISPHIPWSIELLNDYNIARTIQHMIAPYIGQYEIIHCTLSKISTDNDNTSVEPPGNNIGYDVAYPGGDLYSAVYNGLICNPSEKLCLKYLSQLNEYRLFRSYHTAVDYYYSFIDDDEDSSEATATFVIYKLIADLRISTNANG